MSKYQSKLKMLELVFPFFQKIGAELVSSDLTEMISTLCNDEIELSLERRQHV